MRNSMTNDGQMILMNKLLEEMALLRLRFDELQEWELRDAAVCDAARENLRKDIHWHTIELLLKSFTKIRNLMEEVQCSIRSSSPDAM